MKKKNIITLAICLTVLSIILFTISAIIFNNNSYKYKKNPYYICKDNGFKNEDYTIYNIKEFSSIDGIVVSYVSKLAAYYRNTEKYQKYINDTDYMKDKTYDKKEKSIIYSSSVEFFYDEDGNKIDSVDYSNFKEALESNGYTCLEK